MSFLLYLVFFSKNYGRDIVHNQFNLIPFKSIIEFVLNPTNARVFWVNIVGNIVAFFPMGFFLLLVISGLNKIVRITVVVLLISTIIEINQYIFKVGVFDIDDIILNTIGGFIGVCIYYVSGNHEWGNLHMEQLLIGLKERNVTILINKNNQLSKNGVTINLLGVDDVSSGNQDLKMPINNIDQELYTILLSHSPGIIKNYDNLPADLILSGHTHGGQVRIPFIGALVAPDQGKF
ncbi:MAG: VanZ family protein [Halanaerobiales bacterium]